MGAWAAPTADKRREAVQLLHAIMGFAETHTEDALVKTAFQLDGQPSDKAFVSHRKVLMQPPRQGTVGGQTSKSIRI